jgi:hypothetical protein
MQKRKPVHILTFAATAVAVGLAVHVPAGAADDGSSWESTWTEQTKGTKPTPTQSTLPEDTTPNTGAAEPGAATEAPAPSGMDNTPFDTSAPSTEAPPPASTNAAGGAPVAPASSNATRGTAPAPASTETTGAGTLAPANLDGNLTGGDEPQTTNTISTPASGNQTPAVPQTEADRNPLCTLDAFQKSDFVQYSSWPGIGPFRGNAPEYTDPNQNRLTVDVNQDRVTAAQLSVADAPSDLLKLQMSADFLLESVGAKPGKIAAFNTQLERVRPQLSASSSGNPINLTAGNYLVYIYPENQTADSLNYIIKVNSKDATADLIKSSVPETPARPPKPDVVAAVTPTVAPSHRSNSTDMKQQFVDLINKWQVVKRSAVRQRDTSGLSSVLSGKALQQQMGAIQWLTDNHKYCDTSAQSVTVDRFVEVVKGQKYTVFAQIVETNKYVDDKSNEVLKETSDTKKVSYTVEKTGDRWFIIDSEWLNPPAETKASR